MSKMQETFALAGDLPPASQTRFGFVLAEWLHHPEVGVNEAAVLAALTIHANPQGECWPGQVLLGGLLDRGREWVGGVVDHLVEIGILEKTRTYYGYRYRFLVWKAPKPAETPNVATRRHSNVASERHAEHHHKKQDSEESPLPPKEGEKSSSFTIIEGRKSRRGRLDPAGIAEAFERAARRVEAMQDAQPEVSDAPADGAIVPVSEAALPALCPEENQAVGWILSICPDRASTREWPADVRRALLKRPELVETALARKLITMRGAPPAAIACMLKVFQDRISTFQDIEGLETELTADIVTLAAELPEDLLHLAYKRVNAGWKAGFTRRPAAGDFMAAVKDELSDRRDEIRWLKTGLDRIRNERDRQDRIRNGLT